MRWLLPTLGLLFFTPSSKGAEDAASVACEEIARLANTGELWRATQRVSVAASTEIAPAGWEGQSALAYDDIDSDGLKELVFPGADGPHYVHLDGSRPGILLGPELESDPESDEYLELIGVLGLDASIYLLFGRGDDLTHASTYKAGVQQLACNFGPGGDPPRLIALTRYEALVHEAREAGIGLWEFAAASGGTHRLETLSRNRVPMNDSTRQRALLVQAFEGGRLEAFDWLLAHGADPNEGRDEYMQVLQVVLWRGDFARAIAVMRAGAAPNEVNIKTLAEILQDKPDAPDSLALAAAGRLGAVPEAILLAALDRPNLFDALIATKLPVRPDWWEWHAGVRIAMRPDAAAEYAKHPGALEKARGAYARLVPPVNRHAAVNYGDGIKGWRFQLAGRNSMPHKEFLLFATAFCVYFLTEECGPLDLQRQAEAWARGLANTCADQKLAGKFELAPCNTTVFYNMAVKPKSPKPMFLLPTGTNWKAGTYSIEEMYRVKKAQRSE